MKKTMIICGLLFCVLLGKAQSNGGLHEAKRDANRELNNGMRTGRNAGDQQKVNDARAAKEAVRNANSPAQVHEAVKEYRAGKPAATPNRSPNGGRATRAI